MPAECLGVVTDVETQTAGRSGSIALNWRILVSVGAVSVVTMPLTAIWFLLAGFLAFVGAAVAAMLRSLRGPQALSIGASVGLGLLAGPTIYLGLAALT